MLKTRVITALVLVPLVLAAIFGLSTPAFAIAMLVPIVVGGWEWSNLMGVRASGRRMLYVGTLLLSAAGVAWLSFDLLVGLGALWWLVALLLVRLYPAQTTLWSNPITLGVIGHLLLIPTWWGLSILHRQEQGAWWLLYALLLVWSADTGAYFAGRRFGQHKLAAAVSPGKTIEGLVGGLLLTAVVAIAVASQLEMSQCLIFAFLAISLVAVLGSVLGDLFESMCKRHRGIKDSGSILPGHGGVLDRIDSVTAAVPLFVCGMLALELFR